jgi:uncharacterized membrane protein YoaK (UPF0700 family)
MNQMSNVTLRRARSMYPQAILGGMENRMTRLPLLLSGIAGMVDTTGFLTLGNLFTAHVTGNLVVMAAALVRGERASTIQILIAPIFMVAVFFSWLIAKRSSRRGLSPLRVLLWVQFLLLGGVLIFGVLAAPAAQPKGVAAAIAATIAVCAMGCQFALLRVTLPGVPSTAVMTGHLTDIALSLFESNASDRLKRSAQVLAGFLAGCVIAGLAVHLMEDGAWVLPTTLAALALFTSRHGATISTET